MTSYQYRDDDQTNLQERIFNLNYSRQDEYTNCVCQDNLALNINPNRTNEEQDNFNFEAAIRHSEIAQLESQSDDSFRIISVEDDSKNKINKCFQMESYSASVFFKDEFELKINKFQSEHKPESSIKMKRNCKNYFQFNAVIDQTNQYIMNEICQTIKGSFTQSLQFINDTHKIIVQLLIIGEHLLFCKIKPLKYQNFSFRFYVTDLHLNQTRYDKIQSQMLFYKLNKWNSTLKIGSFYIKNSRIFYKVIAQLYEHPKYDRFLKFIFTAGKRIFTKYQDELDRICNKQDCSFDGITQNEEISLIMNVRKKLIVPNITNSEAQIKVKIVEEKMTKTEIPVKQFVFSTLEAIVVVDTRYFFEVQKLKFKFSKYFTRFFIEEIKGRPKVFYIKQYKKSLSAVFSREHCNIFIKLQIWKQLIQALFEIALVDYRFYSFRPENIYLTGRYNVRINLCPQKVTPSIEELQGLHHIYDTLLYSDTNCIREFQQTQNMLGYIQSQKIWNQKDRMRILECLLDETQQLTNYYKQFSDI